MCELNLCPPLSKIDKWLSLSINPEVNQILLQDKIGNDPNYSSSGIEISIVPNINLKKPFYDNSEYMSLGGIPMEVLAPYIKDSKIAQLIESVKVLDKPLEPGELLAIESKYQPTPGHNCPTFIYKQYPDSSVLVKFKTFELAFDVSLIRDPSTISKYLYYTAKFIEFSLPLPSKQSLLLQQDFKSYVNKYQIFLFGILRSCPVSKITGSGVVTDEELLP